MTVSTYFSSSISLPISLSLVQMNLSAQPIIQQIHTSRKSGSSSIPIQIYLGAHQITKHDASALSVTDRVPQSLRNVLTIGTVPPSVSVFAFSRSYIILFIARALQGVGSSCSSVAGRSTVTDLLLCSILPSKPMKV